MGIDMFPIPSHQPRKAKASSPWGQLTGLFLALLAAAPAAAQYVASDACGYFASNAYTVGDSCDPRPFHKLAGFTPSFDPGTCGSSLNADAFGWFTGTGDEVTVDLFPNNTEDPVLHIFTGPCGSLTEVACANALGNGGSERCVVPTISGVQYLVRVQCAGSDAPMQYADICIYDTPPPPPNDDPCHATFLDAASNCSDVTTSSLSSATTTPGIPDPGCYYYGQADIWYTALVPPSGHIIVDSDAQDGEGPGDSGMAFYTASACNQPMSLVVCNDDQSPSNHMPAIERSGLPAGDTVYIRFWSYYLADGRFSICASPDASTLPVELVSFQAAAGDGQVSLTWATASEKNSLEFVVQRAQDGVQFTSIGTVPAAGDALYRNDYAFTDKQPWPGVNYYRLAQVDRDGSTKLTNTVVAVVRQPDDALVAYPNPARDQVQLVFRAEQEGTATITLMDAPGRIVQQEEVPVHHGNQAATLPLGPLARGWYRVQVSLPGGHVLHGGQFLKE
jgi:hypothetical protein